MKNQEIYSRRREHQGRKIMQGIESAHAPVTFRGYQDKNHLDQWAQENERQSLLGSRAAVFGHEVANSLTIISSSLQFVEMELERKQVNDPGLIAIIRG